MEQWLPYTKDKNKDGFRLLLLVVQNHTVLARKGNSCRIQFYNTITDDTVVIGSKPYTTVIIGANGIGKSYILSVIVDIFRYLKIKQEGGASSVEQLKFRFAIQYFFNGHSYKITSLSNNCSKEKLLCWEDDTSVGLHRCPLPVAVLASAISITDRFKTQKQQDDYYWYLGARNENTPSTIGTKALVRKTVSAIAECLSQDDYFKNRLFDLLEDLHLERRLTINYTLRHKKVYMTQPISEEEFINTFDNWEEVFRKAGSNRKTAPWGKKRFETVRKDPHNITLIVNYLNRVINNNNLICKGNKLSYDIQDNSFQEDWRAIQLLSELDILSYPQIIVYKKARKDVDPDKYPFEESSSGETNLLCQFINILSRIQHHSLVLIDEPETSTHPNWQIQYIEWINRIFKRFHTCHFIIATHSHFLLSDLEEGYSSIVALDRNKHTGEIENLSSELNTFGWSTDDILYEVFKIRNTKNEALERDLERAIQLLDEGAPVSDEEVEAILKRFNDVYRGSRDPLGQMIKEIEEYAKSRP